MQSLWLSEKERQLGYIVPDIVIINKSWDRCRSVKNLDYVSKFANQSVISQTKLQHKQTNTENCTELHISVPRRFIFLFAYLLPDFCFMDSKLVVREKRASRGDLPSQLLCLASVTSLALLLVWLRMSSVNRKQFSLRLLTCRYWPIPKDLTPTFFITTASSLVSSISTSLSLENRLGLIFSIGLQIVNFLNYLKLSL